MGITQTDTIVNSAGTGAPTFTNGLILPGGVSGYAPISNGSGLLTLQPITGTGNVAANDSNVVFTAADNRSQTCLPTANRTYTLPTTAILSGDTWTFINRSSSFVITLNASGGTVVTTIPPKCTVIIETLAATPTTNTQWNITFAQGGVVSYTPILSAGFGTATNITGKARRDGDYLDVFFSFTTGTVAGSAGSISFPWSVSIDTSSIGITGNAAGTAGSTFGTYGSTGAANGGLMVTAPSTSTTLIYLSSNSLTTVPNAAASGVVQSGQVVTGSFKIPIVSWKLNAN